MEVVFDEGTVAEEVFVEEVLTIVGANLEHADGETFVGVRLELGVTSAGEPFGEVGAVKRLEPAAFGAGATQREPMTVNEALDEDLLRGSAGLEFVEDVLAKLVEVGGGFEGEHDAGGRESVLQGVEASLGFAGGGAGSGGLLRVAAVRVDLLLSGHGSSSVFRVTGGPKFKRLSGGGTGGQMIEGMGFA